MAKTDPRLAYALMEEGKAIIVDVREKSEIKSGMVKNAVWFPKSKMTSDPHWKEDFLKLTKGKKIFLYCRSGKRSEECQEILKENGIQSESIGGFKDLKTALPITKPKE